MSGECEKCGEHCVECVCEESNMIDYGKLIHHARRASTYFKERNDKAYEHMDEITQALEAAKANEGKFDDGWVTDHYLKTDGSFYQVQAYVKETQSKHKNVRVLIQYEPPTLESQLIDGQLYMIEGEDFPMMWVCDGEVCEWHTGGARLMPKTYKPQTDDKGHPIMCGPLKNGDV